MWSYKARWVLYNGNELILKRRRFFFWWKYQPFSNLENAADAKLSAAVEQLEKAYSARQDVSVMKNTIIKEIQEARDCEANFGPIKRMSLNFFTPMKLASVKNNWAKFVQVMRNRGTIADQITSATSVKVRDTDPTRFTPTYGINSDESVGVVGESSIPVQMRKQNNNSKQNNRNTQNNN